MGGERGAEISLQRGIPTVRKANVCADGYAVGDHHASTHYGGTGACSVGIVEVGRMAASEESISFADDGVRKHGRRGIRGGSVNNAFYERVLSDHD